MPSPFPGMDPYLEAPAVFSGLHDRLVNYTVEQLQPQLMSRGYFIDSNERVWVDESTRDILPDDAILQWRNRTGAAPVATLEADTPVRVHCPRSEFRQPYLEIFDQQNHKLITGIEFVSPTNKSKTAGRRLYVQKQRELQDAGVNLVEVDLLRRGRHVLAVPQSLAAQVKPWDYLICLWRSNLVGEYDLYPISLRSRLPRVRIPLKPGDSDAVLDLQDAFNRAYDVGPYPVRLRYGGFASPRLTEADQVWATQILEAAGLRRTMSEPKGN